MKHKNFYLPDICDSPEKKQKFEDEWEDALQDWKRLKALQRHFLETADGQLPLEYGHVLILKETIKNRFLNEQEKQLLKMLCATEGIDYSLKCYKQYSERRRLRGVQLDMFPQLFEFTLPMTSTEFGQSLRFG